MVHVCSGSFLTQISINLIDVIIVTNSYGQDNRLWQRGGDGYTRHCVWSQKIHVGPCWKGRYCASL